MERKTTKLPGQDAKKQDVAVNNKPWPRSNKKRESSASGPPKDVTRKQPIQRTKSFDKRAKPRESQHESSLGGKADSRLENYAEVGSVFLPGNKKQNLNHLLNFHYTPRDVSRYQQGRGNRKTHGLVYTNTHKHNKELFLQSNCQFVVKADGDYSSYLIDPDIPICWDIIEQINIRVSEPLSCPICLGETVAGRITRCGHTYCWPCLLHYFALSDGSSRPCPICFQPIDKIHLKSVQGVWQNHVPVGGKVNMKLMRRLRGNIAIEPAPPLESIVRNADAPTDKLHSISEQEISTLFSKLLTASHQEVCDIIARERQELNRQLSPELEYPEFVLEALNLLQKREESLVQNSNIQIEQKPVCNQNNPTVTSENENYANDCEIFKFDQIDETNIETAENSDMVKADLHVDEITKDPNHVEGDPVAENKILSPDKYFYFYQAADGQAIFLHAVNIRIIEATWGSLSQAPRDLHGKIIERESGSVETESRRRLRYLQHLPIHCPYDVVEIEIETPFVSRNAIHLFKGELDDRKRKRQKRAREEKHREKVISQKESIIMGHTPSMDVNINSELHFPSYQPGLDMSPPINDWKCDTELIESSPGSSSSKNDSKFSFAKMASGSGSWGNRIPIRSATDTSINKSLIDDGSSDEDSNAPPVYNLSDAISAALLNTSLNSHENGNPSKEGKKKKKQKQKVLFTTFVKNHNAID